jgi:hypothetical protein
MARYLGQRSSRSSPRQSAIVCRQPTTVGPTATINSATQAGWATAALSGASDFSAGDALRVNIEVTSGTFAPTSNQALIHALLAFPVAGWA